MNQGSNPCPPANHFKALERPLSEAFLFVGDFVERFYGVSREILCQKNRPSHPATQVAMYLAREKKDLSLIEIGTYFGGRHYSAVSAAHRRVELRRQPEPKFHEEIIKVEAILD